MTNEHPNKKYVVCIDNRDYPASLELRKIYEVIPDEAAARRGLVRVVDESTEDYLFPETCFAPIDVPKSIEESLKA